MKKMMLDVAEKNKLIRRNKMVFEPVRRRGSYWDDAREVDKNMEDILFHLSQEMNIFTYIVPAFEIKKPGVSKCLSYFPKNNQSELG